MADDITIDYPRAALLPVSRFGLASVASASLAGVLLVSIFGVFAYMSYHEMELDEGTTLYATLDVAGIIALVLSEAGLILGWIALYDRTVRRVQPVLGTALNAFIFTFTLGIIVVGAYLE
ncbi:MAG TPA: hypothetical protein VF624_19385 [Tepidisphaeraceae bacterium]|jgi:hypothetical protein